MTRGSETLAVRDDDRLPTLHRTIRLPRRLWQELKARGIREGKPVREMIHAALDAELERAVSSLRGIGLDGQDGDNKLVRAPLDDNLIGLIGYGRRQTGLPAVELLRLCLRRFLASSRGQQIGGPRGRQRS